MLSTTLPFSGVEGFEAAFSSPLTGVAKMLESSGDASAPLLPACHIGRCRRRLRLAGHNRIKKITLAMLRAYVIYGHAHAGGECFDSLCVPQHERIRRTEVKMRCSMNCQPQSGFVHEGSCQDFSFMASCLRLFKPHDLMGGSI